MGSEIQIKKNNYVSCIVFFISLVIVTLHIIPVIFPAFYTVIMSEIPSSISIYEPGELTFPLVVTNLFLLAFGVGPTALKINRTASTIRTNLCDRHVRAASLVL